MFSRFIITFLWTLSILRYDMPAFEWNNTENQNCSHFHGALSVVTMVVLHHYTWQSISDTTSKHKPGKYIFVLLLLVCCLRIHFYVLLGAFRSPKPGQNIAYFTKTNFRISLMINQRWFKQWLGTATSNRRQIPYDKSIWSLLWRHNEPDDVSNHQPHDCLLNRLFGHRSKKTSKLRVSGLCVGNSPETGEFPAQMASNAENVSIWWRHHGA